MEYEDELDRMRARRQRSKTSKQHQQESSRPSSRRQPKRRQEQELTVIDFNDLEEEISTPKRRARRAGGGRKIQDREGMYQDSYDSRRYQESSDTKARKRTKKKKHRFLFLKLILAAVLIGAVIYFVFQFVWGGFGYWTIAVFGVDSRSGNLESGALSDVEMLCVINRRTGEIKLVSVYRDTYLEISPDGTYHKINEAYFKGGHTQAIEALERNLDLEIDDYATFNWKAVADAITILGGIDLEISDSEFQYINGFITETVESTGLGSHHLEHAGMNHLDGVQAVAYARLRLMDTDYNRTARQRLVIQLAMNKAKEADFNTLKTLVQAVIPQLSTSVGIDDLLPMVRNIRKYHIGETGGFPFSRGETYIGKKDCIIPLTLESNVIQLHQFLYGTEGYQPSQTVKQISARIASDSGMGEVAENAPRARVVGEKALEESGSAEGDSGSGQGSSENSSGNSGGGSDSLGNMESSSPPDNNSFVTPVESVDQTEAAEEETTPLGLGEGVSESTDQEWEDNEDVQSEQDVYQDESDSDDGPSVPEISDIDGSSGPGTSGITGPGDISSNNESDDLSANGEDSGDSSKVHIYEEKPVIETQDSGPGVS